MCACPSLDLGISKAAFSIKIFVQAHYVETTVPSAKKQHKQDSHSLWSLEVKQ